MLRLPHSTAVSDCLRNGEADAPLPDRAPGARRLAGRGDRAEFDADLAADGLHPLPVRDFGHHCLDAAWVVGHAGVRAKLADRDAGHLRFRAGSAHGVCIDHLEAEMSRRHQGWIDLPPPISSGIAARKSVPSSPSWISTARAMLRLSASRSWPTSRAPMLETIA